MEWKNSLKQLTNLVNAHKKGENAVEKEILEKYKQDFVNAISDDLNMPQALGITWQMLRNTPKSKDTYDMFEDFKASDLYPMVTSNGKISTDGKLILENSNSSIKKYYFDFPTISLYGLICLVLSLFILFATLPKQENHNLSELKLRNDLYNIT